MTPPMAANLESIEAKLAELDPIFRAFCSQHGFHLGGGRLQRIVWRREEIDRSMDLAMDVIVAQVIERGFYPEMPWSLYAQASLLPTVRPVRLLTRTLFRSIPYTELSAVLADHLQEGRRSLSGITAEDVMLRGTEYKGGSST